MSGSLHLRLLGGLVLERDGAAVSGRAAQKRRLALLTLLALAPNRSLSRDRLLAYLWPESDTEQGRHLLAVAVYELRKTLGEHVLLTRGDDVELGDSVAVDVAGFEHAVRHGEWERAVEAYRGPLLDGFHLSGAPEWERWVDGERDRLARSYANALETVARTRGESGQQGPGLEAWHTLAALDPYNSRIVRELMLALESAGDRAAALRIARAHTTLMREEFNAAPDPDIEALSSRLRSTPVPAAATAESAAPVTHESIAGNADAAEPLAAGPDPVVRPPSASAERETQTAGRRLRRSAAQRMAVIGGLVVVALTGWVALLVQPLLSADADSCSDAPRIAVLPFRPLAGERHTYFGDGLAEDILNALGGVQCLDVVPRTAAFAFRDGEEQVAAKQLEVTHYLSATWASDSGWLRVNPRLVEAGGRQIWSGSYEREGPWSLPQITEVQQEIALAVVAELRSKLGRGVEPPRVEHGTDNQAAWLALYEGRQRLDRRSVPDMIAAKDLFAEAVKLDPEYAAAHAAQAEVTALLGAYDYGLLPPRDAYAAAERSALAALSRDSTLAEAHATLGIVYFNHRYQWARADSAFRRAMRLKPGYSQAYHWHALLLSSLGRTTEARAQLERGLSYDRHSVILRSALSRSYYFARDTAAAIRGYRGVVLADSSFFPAHLGLGLALAQAGRLDDALAAFERAERMLPEVPVVLHALIGYVQGRAGNSALARDRLATVERIAATRYIPAEYFVLLRIGLGETDAAIDALEDVHRNGSGGVAYLGIEPVLDPLRGHPRFEALARRLQLP